MRLHHGQHVVILSGAGLSAASGIPTFRDADGLWEQHPLEEVASPDGWERNPELVRRFYDERRMNALAVLPNPAHEALARFQQCLGPRRVTLVTQNVDGLLQKAGAVEVLEMHGSLWSLRCARDGRHPHIPLAGRQPEHARCSICGSPLRPDIVWFGEAPLELERITEAVLHADLFVAVGTSGVVYPAAGLVRVARQAGAYTVEVNPTPSGEPFSEVLAQPAEIAIPRLVAAWLGETVPET